MIYFDNAATGGFKPNAVLTSAENTMRHLCANPGRSGHRLSVIGAKIVYDCRKLIAEKFGTVPEKVIFTKNCTEALNIAIFGSVKIGGEVITTVYEHNSVLRPLHYLEKKGVIDLKIVAPKDGDIITPITQALSKRTCLVIMTGASNVTGEATPIRQLGEILKNNKIPFLVDGAQAGGHIPLDMKKDKISYVALAGHKGLHGIAGSGILILSEHADLSPVFCGGTGTESLSLAQPEIYPEKLESGTLNLPAISALFEGVRYTANNISTFATTLNTRTKTVIDAISRYNGVRVFSQPNPCGIISFNHQSVSSSDFADELNRRYDIAVRAGFHCAPLMHKHLKTDGDGLVRISIAPQNTDREIAVLLSAISQIIQTANN